MEQGYLFSPAELIRNKAVEALTQCEFNRSEAYWQDLEIVDPGNGFSPTGLAICRFWTALYPLDGLFDKAEPVELHRQWRDFETYIDENQYKGKAIVGDLKENLFLRWIGLGNTTPALRQSFRRQGIEVLDLLIEIEKWDLAIEEIRAVRTENLSYEDTTFFLKCFKVHYKAGHVGLSRRFLSQAFWDDPDKIEMDDVAIDDELLHAIDDLPPGYETGREPVELIPYVGLITRLFTCSVYDPRGDLLRLRRQAEKYETGNNAGMDRGLRCRLFSLYAWEADLTNMIGADCVEIRRKMKALDENLFAHYMESKRNI